MIVLAPKHRKIKSGAEAPHTYMYIIWHRSIARESQVPKHRKIKSGAEAPHNIYMYIQYNTCMYMIYYLAPKHRKRKSGTAAPHNCSGAEAPQDKFGQRLILDLVEKSIWRRSTYFLPHHITHNITYQSGIININSGYSNENPTVLLRHN